MEQAKSAVNKIIGRSGRHDTEVDERVNPAVTQEVVKPHKHEETQQAIDREVHQDHYHTTVQPLSHKEVLPERHSHQQAPLQEREFTHGDHEKVRSGVEAEAARFGNTSTTHQTTQSTSQAAQVAGEHVHHHVHETVQPVIHKESVRPEVVHTTIPIHETHHAQAEHHGLSTLPTKSLDEFKELGGKITGASHRHEEYEGHPRPYNPAMQSDASGADRDFTKHDGLHGRHAQGASGTEVSPGSQNTTGGLGHGTGMSSGLTGNHGTGSGLTGSHGTGSGLTGSHGTGSGLTGSHGTGSGLTGSHGTGSGLTGSHGTGSGLTGSHGTGSGLTGSHGTGEGLTGTHGSRGASDNTGNFGVLGSSNVSGIGSGDHTGSHHTSGHTGVGSSGATGTALGGRTEGNTVGRAVDSASHGTTGVGSSNHGSGVGVGTTGTDMGAQGQLGRGVGNTATLDSGATGVGSATHHDRGHADTRSSVNTGSTGAHRSDVQTSSQATDPSLVESEQTGSNWKGQGADGSHSAVFGLTPDGHVHKDTKHGQSELTPAHSKSTDYSTTSDAGSRAPTGQGVAGQMNQPGVLERGHGGPGMPDNSSSKPGAGSSLGGSQGFGEVRPQDHGAGSKMKDKMDPTTDSDRDGKRGVMD